MKYIEIPCVKCKGNGKSDKVSEGLTSLGTWYSDIIPCNLCKGTGLYRAEIKEVEEYEEE